MKSIYIFSELCGSKIKNFVCAFFLLLFLGNVNAQVIQVGTGVVAPTVGTNPGSGANGASPYGVNVGSGAGGKRLQILYTATQINAALTAAGLTNGVPYVISTTSWDVSSATGTSASRNQIGTTIKMANTAATSLAFGSPITGLTTVFGATNVTFPTGTGYLVTNTLATPFTWDGTSNLVVEYCYTFSGVGLISTYGACRRTNTGVVQMIYNGGAAVNCGSSFVTNVQAIPNVRLTVASACAQPSPIASNMSFSGLGTANVTVNWTNGGGASRVVVAHATTAVSAGPATGIDYTAGANSIFGSGTNLGSSNFVVYAGTGSSVNVTGLTGGTTYFFSVYEASATFCYTTGLSGSQSIPACLSYPTTDATAMVFSNILNNAMTLSFTRGNGSNVLVVARLTATARVAPTFNTSYTPNTIFGSGNTTGAGNFVVMDGTANTVSVTGLANFTAYTFDVYEYNASPNCYSPSPLIAGTSTLDGTTSGGCSATVVRSTAAGQYTAVTPSTYLTITGATNSNYTGNPIGFNFVYNGVTYTSFGLNTNGYIWFGTGSPLATATNPISNASANLGGTGTIEGIVSALGTFLTSGCVYPTITPARSEIGYLVTGVAPDRVLTIQWRGYAAASTNCGGNCELFGFTDISRLDFQIKLHEDGGANSDKIVLTYWDQNPVCIDAAAFSAQVGLRGATNATFTNRTGGGNASWALNAGVVNTSVCTNGASNFISGNVSLTFTQAITTGPTINGFVSGGSASNSCPATDVLLTAGSGFTSYQWFFNGSIIAGPGSNSSTYTATATGAYTVVGKNGTCYAQSNAFNVTINSCGVAPAITSCGSSIPQGNDPGLCSAIVNYSAATATGTPTPTITYSQNSGTSFPVGTTTVIVTASNGILPDATCSFTVTVNDTEAPLLGPCPSDISQCDNHVALFSIPAATDNCAGTTVLCAPASGSTFPAGNTVVTCTATDAASLTSSCTFNVTINETPVMSACPADISQCDNYIASWTDPTASGTPAASVSCTPASGSTFAAGTTTVTCAATNSCGSSSCSFNVTVNETPVISACPANISQCDIYIASWTDPTATGTPAASVSCTPASGSTFAAGTTTVTCTATNSCGTDQCTFTVTINETPVIGSCPANITTCNPVVTFATPSSTGTPAATVTCSPASGSTFAPGNTTVNCTATNTCGSSSCSFTVNVQTPSAAATSATSNALYGQICIGGNITLTANGGSLGTGASWVWYDGGCGTGASVGSGSPLTITPALGNHNYFVRAEGACGNTACVSVAVSVISAPPSNTIGITSAPADGCVGAPAQTVSVNNVANCTFYNWSSSQTGVRFNGFPSPYQTSVPTVSVTYVSLPAAGSSGWSICVFGGNVCGNTNTICAWVRATIGAPTSVSGASIGCPGSSGNAYSSSTVAGAVSYQWSSTGGIVVAGNGAQAITVSFPAGFVTGTLSVRGQTSCGYMGPNRTITINANPTIPGAISGTSYPCPNASSTYSIAPVPGAVNYTWTTSVAGAVVTGNTTSCSILFPAAIPGGSTVSVIANSSCPTSSAVRSKGIAGGLPSIPSVISGPVSGQCGQTGVSYFINPVSNATGYSWSSTCGTIVGPTNLSGISMDWASNMTSCIISVSSVNACGNSAPRTLLVLGAPNTPTSISGPLSVCANDVSQYCANGSNGATSFQWTVPAGATILGPANGVCILVQWGATGGTIIARAINDCGMSGSKTQAVAVTCRNAQVSGVSIPSVEIFPNPTTGKVNIQYYTSESTSLSIQALDITGRIIIAQDLITDPGINIHELDLSSLAKGVYIIHLNGKEINEMLKVTVE